MSIFKRIEKREASLNTLTELLKQRGGNPGYTGETVNESSALSVSTVMACVSLLSDSIAGLPLHLFREQSGRKVELSNTAFLDKPNINEMRFETIHQIITSLAIHGNSYSIIDRDKQGRVTNIQNIHPSIVKVKFNGSKRSYQVNNKVVDPANMLHILWFSQPGQAEGISPLRTNKNTIGLALAMERHVAQWYGQGATPSSVLETEHDLTPEQAKMLQDSWSLSHNMNRKPAVLTGGLRWKAIQSEAGSELGAARELQVSEIARIFRVPSNMINAQGPSMTYSNVQSQGTAFLRFTLLPWINRVEQALTSLFPRGQFVKFDVGEYLRSDKLTQVKTQQTMIASGLLTPNEARFEHDLEPYEGGDKFVMALPGAPMATPFDPPPVGEDQETPEDNENAV